MFLVTILKKFFPNFRLNFSRRQERPLRNLVNKNFNKIVFLWSEVVYSTFSVKVYYFFLVKYIKRYWEGNCSVFLESKVYISAKDKVS